MTEIILPGGEKPKQPVQKLILPGGEKPKQPVQKPPEGRMQVPGDLLVRARTYLEEVIGKIAPQGVPEDIRQQGLRDFAKALKDFGELLPEFKNTRDLMEFVKKTNAFDEYRIKNNLAVSVVFDGRVHGTYEGNTPLEIVYTGSGEIKNKKVLDGMLDEGTRLAEAMQRKNVLWDTPWDGGKTTIASEGKAFRAVTVIYGSEEVEKYIKAKGGVRFTRIAEGMEHQSEEDKKSIVENWVASSVNMDILGQRYIAGPDMNMSKDMMSLIVSKGFEEAEKQGKRIMLPTTSRGTEEGGFDHFKWAVTSRGAVESMLAIIRRKRLMDKLGIDTSNISVIIQGFGDVGSGIAKILIEEYQKYGIKIAGISDKHGAIYKADGLGENELMKIRHELEKAEEEGKNKDTVHITDLYKGEVDRKWVAAKGEDVNELMYQQATILMPAAGANAITSKNVDRLQVKMIVEGANNAIERGLERTIHDKGIAYFRGEIINGGGVYTSTDEFFHYMMEGDSIKERMEEYRVHVIDGIKELAVSNMNMVMDLWEASNYQKTLTEVVYGLADSILASRRTLLKNQTPQIVKRARDDVARSSGKMPETMAVTIAASESAREHHAYGRENPAALCEVIQENYDRTQGEDPLSDYLDRRRMAVYKLGKMRNPVGLTRLVSILADGKEHIEVRKNAAEALGNIFGWIAEGEHTTISRYATGMLKRAQDRSITPGELNRLIEDELKDAKVRGTPIEETREVLQQIARENEDVKMWVWSAWALEKMGQLKK